MVHWETPLINGPAHGPRNPRVTGVYGLDFHFYRYKKLQHRFIHLGKDNPMSLPPGELLSFMLQQVEELPGQYRRKREVPTRSAVGATVLRACLHDFKTPAKRMDRELVAEKVAALAFVPNLNSFRPIDTSRTTRKPTLGGFASLWTHEAGRRVSVGAQHLQPTPAEENLYRVSHVTPSLATGDSLTAWVALRAKEPTAEPADMEFVETRVTYEEIMDTLNLAG